MVHNAHQPNFNCAVTAVPPYRKLRKGADGRNASSDGEAGVVSDVLGRVTAALAGRIYLPPLDAKFDVWVAELERGR